LSVQILSKKLVILRTFQRDLILTVYLSSCKVPIILVRF